MYCPNCGKEYYQDHNFCRFCGYDLKLNIARNAVPPNNNDKNINNQSENQLNTENEEKEVYTTKLIDKKNRLTPKSIAIITIIFVVIIFIVSILWSVDIATQINPNTTEEETSFEIKAPSDEEPNIYAKEPEIVERHDKYTEPPVIEEEKKIEEETAIDENADNSEASDLKKDEEPPVNDMQGETEP